ncbi:MAG: hypothetical protein HY996_09695 [Micrococcales bacterium]|nr:hypothetical protein [Micrococcales bacterium]
MRKFLFNTSVISAVFGVFSIVQMSRRGPRDWRLVLQWLSWGMSVAIAVGTVVDKQKAVEAGDR